MAVVFRRNAVAEEVDFDVLAREIKLAGGNIKKHRAGCGILRGRKRTNRPDAASVARGATRAPEAGTDVDLAKAGSEAKPGS